MKVAVLSKLKHATLLDAVRKVGSVAKLAALCEVNSGRIYDWLAMRAVPPTSPNQWWPQEKLDKLEVTLIDLTGQSLEQLFPSELRDKAWLAMPKTIEYRRDVPAELLKYRPDALALPAPQQAMELEELKGVIKQAMNSLSYREREILKWRFGFDCKPLTLLETASHFKVTAARIRQIECHAIQKLKAQNPKLATFIVGVEEGVA